MPPSIFISYATPDKETAFAVCETLEQAGISCWIAPRNITPGSDYDDGIMEGLNRARVLVLIYTAAIFQSKFVKKEVERANAKGMKVIPVRLEAILPEGGWEFQLSLVQWLDALSCPLEPHLARLVEIIRLILAPAGKPPEPAKVPAPAGFVGRVAELTSFASRLAATHLAVICGMPGMGKTAFAAKLAGQAADPARTFWHSFRAGDSLNILLKKLAGFLFYQGDAELWHLVQQIPQGDPSNQAAADLIDFMFKRMAGQDFLLCLDNFQVVEDDPLLDFFYEGLAAETAAGHISALVISEKQLRVFPEIQAEDLLNGLNLAEAAELIARQNLVLAPELLARLYQCTGGNVQFLLLAADALKRSKFPARLIDRLFEANSIEAYLIEIIDKKLNGEERRLLSAAAVFLDFPASQAAIRFVLGGQVIRPVLAGLADRYLISVSEDSEGYEYHLTPMMQAFYYDLLSASDQKTMHHLAGEFFSSQEPAPLQAAMHFQRAGENEQAIELATRDVWAMLNLGQARYLRQVLSLAKEEGLEPRLAARLDLARGQVSGFLGEKEAAAGFYEAVRERLAGQADEPAVRLLQARACRGLGELLEGDQPQKALEYLECGLQALAAGDSPAEAAALKIRVGRIHALLGEFATAEQELKEGLAGLPGGPSRARISALGNLGSIACLQGNPAGGLAYYQQVLEIARQSSDYWSLVEVELNIGIELDIGGRLAESAEHYQGALEQARHLGSLAQQARTLCSLGILHTKLGDYALAEAELSEGIGLAGRAGQQFYLIYYLPGLADLRLRQGRAEEAAPLLAEAARLAHETGAGEVEALPEIHRLWALVWLARSDPRAAQEQANQALALGREHKSAADQGTGLRVLGEVQLALGNKTEAWEAFKGSLAILKDCDPYEAARTQMAWGISRVGEPGDPPAELLLREAETAFEKLGAKRELETVRKFL